MGDGTETKFCPQCGEPVSKTETKEIPKRSKDKSHKSKVKTILLTSLAVVLAVGGGYVATHAKCRVVVREDGRCYVESGLFEKKQDVKSLKVPKGTRSIGGSAFLGCSSLSSVGLPESLTSIGDSAFYVCRSLSSVSFPEGLTSIGNSAFYGCSSLSSVSLPEGLTSIGKQAFCECSSLSGVSLPEGLTSIGNWAFEGCSSLSNVNLPEGLTSIGESAFAGCSSLTSIDLPKSVTSIESDAFRNSGLEEITMTKKQAKDFQDRIPNGVVIHTY